MNANKEPTRRPIEDAPELPPAAGITSEELRTLVGQVPVLLVVANEIELKAVWRELRPGTGRSSILAGNAGAETYLIGRLGNHDVVVVQCYLGSTGQSGSQEVTGAAIELFHPQVVIAVGVALGKNRRKQKLGDVLLAKNLVLYEPQRVQPGRNVPRGPIPEASPRVLSAFRTLGASWRAKHPDGKPVRCVVGPVLTGEKLIDEPRFKKELFTRYPDAIGAEMEGAGLYSASARRKTDYILVKAICDWAVRKNSSYQPQAAANAVHFVKHVLSHEHVFGGPEAEGSSIPPGRGEVAPADAGREKRLNDWFSLSNLPSTGSLLVGRAHWLRLLTDSWSRDDVRFLSIVAEGGIGKTSLVNHWLHKMSNAKPSYLGAGYVLAWSFYNQGTTGQQASSESFFSWILRLVGDPSPDDGTPWERGVRLATALRARRGMLILDGLEPLQHPPGPQTGRLRDQGVLSFLREFAAHNEGLCVVTSRLPLTDLADFIGIAGRERLLKPLSPSDGAKMLRALGVRGTRHERLTAARAFRGHCLGLTLLAGYVVNRFAGDPRRFREVRPLRSDERAQRHARRVLQGYADWFKTRPELSVLYALSFLDRPADRTTIELLAETEDSWRSLLDHDTYRNAVSTLSAVGLVNPLDPGLVETHPLVREHFGEFLEQRTPIVWRRGHNRLYEHLIGALPERPETRPELEVAHSAARHACKAARQQEALTLLDTRVFQIELGTYFSLDKFGMYAEALAALTELFEQPWSRPSDVLTAEQQAHLLITTGYCLRAIGDLSAAIQATRLSRDRYEALKNYGEAADAAGNLTQMLTASGRIKEAIASGSKGAELARSCKDKSANYRERVNLANHGDARHQAWRLKEAQQSFERAEMLQAAAFPDWPTLISYRGFLYCDLLLSLSEFDDVHERASRSLSHPKSANHPAVRGLDYLTLAKVEMLRPNGDLHLAKTHLEKAEELVRTGGDLDDLPRVLVALAEVGRLRGDVATAQTQLRQAVWLCERAGQNLRMVDCLTVQARVEALRGSSRKARNLKARATQMAAAMGYARALRSL